MTRLIAAVLLMLVVSGVYAEDTEEILLTWVGRDDSYTIYTIDADTAARLPSWTPQDGREPFGVFEASDRVMSKHPDGGMQPWGIRLLKINYKGKDIWFYLFEVDPPVMEVVLMSGELANVRKVNSDEFFSISGFKSRY